MCLRGLFPYPFNKPAPANKVPLQSESGSGSSTPPTARPSRPPSPTNNSTPCEERAIRPVPVAPVAPEVKSAKAGSAAVVPPDKTPEMNSLRFIKHVGKGKGYGKTQHYGPVATMGCPSGAMNRNNEQETTAYPSFLSKLTGSSWLGRVAPTTTTTCSDGEIMTY